MALIAKDVAASVLTAGATQTLAGATPILTDVSTVTVTTANDGVLLPQVAPGMVIFVKNLSANAGKTYVANGGTIDGTAGATGTAGLIASKTVAFACTGITASGGSVWITLFSA